MIDLLVNSPFIKTVYNLAEEFTVEAFLVGGAVRDLHINGYLSTDLDFLVTGSAKSIAQQFAKTYKGSSFCLDKKRNCYRAIISHSGNLETADFASLLENDLTHNLLSRDFTINSIGLRLADIFVERELTFIDPANGLEDLRNKHIRVTTPTSLERDPVRILRALRFTRKYHFTLDTSTETLIHMIKEKILKSPWERIRNEFFLILSQPDISESLSDLERHGILILLLPECYSFPPSKQKTTSAFPGWERTIKTAHFSTFILENIHRYFPQHAASLQSYFKEEIEGGIQRGTLLTFTALLHRLEQSGEGSLNQTNPAQMQPYQLKKTIRAITKRFKLSRNTDRTITTIIQTANQLPTLFPSKDLPERSAYRFMKDMDGPVLDTLIFTLADALTKHSVLPDEITTLPFFDTVNTLMAYYFQEFSKKTTLPLLNGDEIMRVLDLKPGKKVGKLLELVKSAEREGSLSSKEEALQLIIAEGSEE
jgi:tRNA nucleotidyltransferase/poly(A) polymerase